MIKKIMYNIPFIVTMGTVGSIILAYLSKEMYTEQFGRFRNKNGPMGASVLAAFNVAGAVLTFGVINTFVWYLLYLLLFKGVFFV